MATPTLVTVTGDFNPSLKVREIHFKVPVLVRFNAGPDIIPPHDQITQVASDGTFTTQVYGTNDPAWSPSNWTYKVTIKGDEFTTTYDAQVPYDAGTVNLSALLPAVAASEGTLYAAYNHTHEGGGGGGSGPSPASTVAAETSYGVSSAVGAATSYARGDHTHGTPALGTSGTTAAAGNHNHSGTYAPVSHTHLAANISDFTEAVQDVVGAFLAQGTNVTLTYDDAGNTLTIAAAGGGGGGVAPTFQRLRINSGDITPGAQASMTVITGTAISIAAVAGDNVEVGFNCLLNQTASDFFDIAVVNGSTILRYASTGTSSPPVANEGDPSIYPVSGAALIRTTARYNLALVSGDIVGGNVTFALAFKGSGSGKVFASTNYPFRGVVANFKQ